MLVDLGFLPTSTVTVVAQDPAPPPGQGEEFGKASPVALVVINTLGPTGVAPFIYFRF